MSEVGSSAMGIQTNIRAFKEIVRDMIVNTPKHSILGLGGPGIGKSECVQQIAKELGYDLIDLRLAQMSETEIGGLIFPDKSTNRTTWLTPNYFPTNNKTILLLDEITSAPKRVQVAAYQLVLDRRVGQNKLPEGTIVVALGNREDDGGVYVELAAPLANRFEIYDIQCMTNIWIEDYAESFIDPITGRAVHPLVTSYIKEHPADLNKQTENSDSIIFATPRSWKRVSDILHTHSKVDNLVENRIKANLGDVLGAQFISFISNFANITIIDDLMNGKDIKVPSDPKSVLYINSTLVSKFSEIYNSNGTSDESVEFYEKICKVADQETAEYAAALHNSVARIDHDTIAAHDNKYQPNSTDFENEINSLDIFGGEPTDVEEDTDDGMEHVYI